MRSALFLLAAPLLLSGLDYRVFAANAAVPVRPIRAEVIIWRTTAAWESQRVQEPCILPNPKDPARLVMFYSGVPATNRSLCFIGKAWAFKSDPFTWHQDEHNPVFSPAKQGWDSGSIRLDAVLYIAEEDAYYICYSGTTCGWQKVRQPCEGLPLDLGRYFRMVAVKTSRPSLASSSRMRGLPQVGLTAHMRRMSWTNSESVPGRPNRRLDLRRQKILNPDRCQLMRVSGWKIINGALQFGQSLLSMIQCGSTKSHPRFFAAHRRGDRILPCLSGF
jgi:hypothetical protein